MSLVIIKTIFSAMPNEYNQTYELFREQKEHGLILLPPGFEATYVPDDVEIKMEDEN